MSEINIPERALKEICMLGKQHDVGRIVLFGSRARGTNDPRSDIDLAVYGCRDFYAFADDVNEKVWTLLEFDLIDMNGHPDEELQQDIRRDGKVIYEKYEK